MKRLVGFFVLLLLGASFTGTVAAQDHLLITEFVVTPTAGEFIEVFNPTGETVDLTNYYLTDEVFRNNNNYINVVQGGFSAFSSDFMVKFPDGATIAPGQFLTVAVSGTGFEATYGVTADFEIVGDSDNTTDMTAVSVGGSAGISNSGEVIILFYWDGESDLVQDVDIVLWGDKDEAVDKTGVSIDGIDADDEASEYAPDTPVAEQTVVNAENDDDEVPHDDGMSAQRRLDVEDVENWSAAGNGITGHDETSENLTWKGGIWSINEPPTPGSRALGGGYTLQNGTLMPDSLTIADVQFLRADSIGVEANEDSRFLGDSLTVSGVTLHSMRKVFLGNRWGGFIQDPRGGPWSGFFVIQHDCTKAGTNLIIAEPGDVIAVPGLLDEFPTAPNTQSITQLALFTEPVQEVDFPELGVPLPEPILLTPADLGATGSSEDPRLTERWESILVRFEDLTVTSNFPGQPGNQMIAGDETGTIAIDDYFLELRDMLDNQTGGQWPGFPTGSVINVTGFVRDVLTGGQGRTTINPRSLDDIEIAASPPAISDIGRDPVAVTSSDEVTVSATIVDVQTAVASAEINYRVDGGDFQQVAMTEGADNVFSGAIPAQADGAFVEYFLTAEDDTGDNTMVPGDTTASKFFYFVRDAGLSIFDLQFTPFENGNSGYSNLQVTVTGIVTTDTTDFSFYWIQDGTDPWSGIWVNDNINEVKLGDMVTVTGTVEERFSATRISDVTEVTVVSEGNPVPGPVVLNTGTLATGSPDAEQYEGMLVQVQNVGVADAFADAPSNFGEFTVDDGSGPVRVDDLGNFRGNLDSTFAAGDSLASLTGIQHFTFGNYKLEPRNDDDVVRKAVSVEEDGQSPFTFDLAQNYPNPFNPATTIRYQVANKGRVSITIFNILGQKVRTLVDAVRPAGAYSITWDGTSDRGARVSSGVYLYRMEAGDFVKVQKMLLLK